MDGDPWCAPEGDVAGQGRHGALVLSGIAPPDILEAKDQARGAGGGWGIVIHDEAPSAGPDHAVGGVDRMDSEIGGGREGYITLAREH